MQRRERVVICVPARYGSARFPGKVLAPLAGKPVVRWVYERALTARADEVIVAVDDPRVYDVARDFGARVVMTRPECPSGTDRVWEAVSNIEADVIVNIQGDEPLIDIDAVNGLIAAFRDDPSIEMGTIVTPAPRKEIADNPNIVKAVLDKKGFALYFSRAGVPFLRGDGADMPCYRHLGIYGFRRATLKRFVDLPEGRLERCEKLEQLRALENGVRIFCLVADIRHCVGVDTPEDLAAAEKVLAQIV